MRKKIIFVDDEDQILKGLQRSLHPLTLEWEMLFFNNAAQALGAIRQTDVDIVVSDIRMPNMNGIQFFTQLKSLKPEVIRIFLTGQTEQDMLVKSIDLAHQFLYKPCDVETLKQVINNSFAVRKTLLDDSIKSVVAKMDFVPPLPHTYKALLERIHSPQSSLTEIGNIISSDVGLASKILKLVNSAFFGLTRKISSPAEAVTYLGLETVKAIVLSMETSMLFEKDPQMIRRIERINEHSILCSLLSKEIAIQESVDKVFLNTVIMAGLLHDIGKLLLYYNFPKKNKDFKERSTQVGLLEAERAVYGSTHGEIGAYLMGLWGLPDPVISCVAYHHEPLRCEDQTFSPLTIIHFVDVNLNLMENGESKASVLVREYLEKTGVNGNREKWSKVMENAKTRK